jgi:hypothetical protein
VMRKNCSLQQMQNNVHQGKSNNFVLVVTIGYDGDGSVSRCFCVVAVGYTVHGWCWKQFLPHYSLLLYDNH